MTYFESVAITMGWYLRTFSVATMTVHIFPIWFDCMVPGTFSAVFLWLFWLNQTPLLQVVFPFPLLKHAPSVYAVIG